MIKSVKLTNFLSFGSNANEIELRPLNIVIGANGCGKSNFIEAFELLRSAPSDIGKPIRDGGGVMEWLYKGGDSEDTPTASLEYIVTTESDFTDFVEYPFELKYGFSFSSEKGLQRFKLVDELVASVLNDMSSINQEIFYSYDKNSREMMLGADISNIKNEWLHNVLDSQSVLAWNSAPHLYREIGLLSWLAGNVRLYRDWNFGKNMPCRQPQKADGHDQFLESDGSNLALMLNKLNHDIPSKRRLLKELQNFYNEVEDYFIGTSGGYVQIYFQERGYSKPIPSTRLSDGTLRYLCLLAILCNPSPPPLICIEEPEIGIHPDILPSLARLMTEASEKSQLIVTTHSDIFVDAFSDNPEAILVAEKTEGETQLSRLNKDQLKPWLEKYRLGALWTRGDIGGTRW